MCVSDVLLLHLMAAGNRFDYLYSVLLIMTCLFAISVLYYGYPCCGPAVSWDKKLDFSPSLLSNRGQQKKSEERERWSAAQMSGANPASI